MAEKLTPEKIEEIAKNFENIQDGKVPIIKSEKETVKLDYGSLDNMRPKDKPKAPDKRILPLIPPSDLDHHILPYYHTLLLIDQLYL